MTDPLHMTHLTDETMSGDDDVNKVVDTGLRSISASFFRRYQYICLYRAGPKPHIHFPHYLNTSINGKQTCFTSCKQRRYQQDETLAATKMPATAKFTSNMYGSPAVAGRQQQLGH
jgi:hypothetical protein